MTERDRDEQWLIDLVLGRCDAAAAEEARRRLESDAGFSALRADVANALSALGAYSAAEPPEDLVDRTMARIRAVRRTEALLEAAPIEPEARRRVFSFRELAALAAVAVLAVGILLPSLWKAHQQAQKALCGNNLAAIFTGVSHYANGNNEALPSVRGESWVDASNSAGLFLLVRNDYAAPEVFQCPAAGGQSFVVQQGMFDFPSPKSIGYSYQHSLDGPIRRDDPELLRVAEEFPILGDTSPMFAGGKFHPDRVGRRVSENHGNTGQNTLRLDGSVFWATHANVGVDGDNIYLVRGVLKYTGVERPASKTDTFLVHQAGR
ncbi:MAG: hypothetical protein AMJ81_10120 [Phycisphaerae bacterium SM23_33]|nr:MAG: hypothetical protein AMJ81_10120 [Phycisphaerae bacterium SM23_33]